MERGDQVNCPELMEGERCNFPAEVTDVQELPSTDGPMEHIGTKCMMGHVLFMPIDMVERQ